MITLSLVHIVIHGTIGDATGSAIGGDTARPARSARIIKNKIQMTAIIATRYPGSSSPLGVNIIF